MKLLNKLFTMVISMFAIFAYKNEVWATGCSANGPASSVFRITCGAGKYISDDKQCMTCPGLSYITAATGATAATITADLAFNGYIFSGCWPCSEGPIASGCCNYVGELNSWGTNYHLCDLSINNSKPISDCYVTAFSDAYGYATFPGGKCNWTD